MKKLFSREFLIVAVFSLFLSLATLAANAQAGAPGGPPAAMPGTPGGGAPMWGGAPAKAALYISDGAENSAKEYTPGQYKANVTSDTKGIKISGLNFSTGDYTVHGVAVDGAKSIVTIENAKIHLGVTKEATKDPGSALTVDHGATVYLNHSDLTVDGSGAMAGRYVAFNANGTLVVNDSNLTQTGPNQFTSKIAEPFMMNALLISGNDRANMSTGTGKTYYFNSTVTTEAWAALSTDTCKDVDLYAYNTKAIALDGGYGNYADTGCRVWLYGVTEKAPEIGAIVGDTGQLYVDDGAHAPADVLKYNLGAKTSAGSVITGGRNAVVIHVPDMKGEGLAAASNGTLTVKNSTLATDRNLKTKRDYATYINKATGAYIDYVMGADILVKSDSATITLENAKLESFSGVAVLTVINSDSMGNFLHNESDGAKVKPIAVSMKDMSVTGDVKHMDYQRIMTLSLDNATLKGAIVSGSVDDWNKLWTAYDKKDVKWIQNDKWNTFYGVRLTVGKGSTWQVTGPSLLESLKVEDGGSVKGKVMVDGKAVTPAAGQTYTGKISVTPL